MARCLRLYLKKISDMAVSAEEMSRIAELESLRDFCTLALILILCCESTVGLKILNFRWTASIYQSCKHVLKKLVVLCKHTETGH